MARHATTTASATTSSEGPGGRLHLLLQLRRARAAAISALAIDCGDAVLNRACKELSELDDAILAARPRTLADLRCQAEVVHANASVGDFMQEHVLALIEHINAMAA